ncbi:hypothetical protein LOTGIDRAFT_173406 [Lottia gigantea]|uniref:Aladin seven-bladed propeller domain-containing protein n=1 Tax=Lottia gigantea TaxID=225164 RepID=V4AYJ4_LOTGI|nr:hypothetical protein LOTGIDRAFT_173406 [Lottia gigantea]ESP00171.1 hypothetical protein LOTGIDRAFT_173406 [Lottia gigantea]
MKNFPPPPKKGEVTVTETNGELTTVGSEYLKESLQILCPGYPEVTVQPDSMRNTTPRESAKSAFLPHDETVWKRALSAWYEHGFTGTFEELVNSRDEVPGTIATMSTTCLTLLRWATSLNGSLFPHLSLSESPVRAFAWHPHVTKFAYALHDDSIKVHTQGNTLTPILKHKLQKYVADLSWQPLSSSVLAVACQTCILVWHVDPNSLAARPSSSCVQVLSQTGHSPISSLAWHPQASLLLSSSPTDTAIMVWSVAMENCVSLRRAGGGGVSLLKFSPDGTRVLAATPMPIFRVWDAVTWNCEVWSKLTGRCNSACWSPDDQILLFTMENDPIIYSITFGRSHLNTVSQDVSAKSNMAVPVADMSETEIMMDDGSIVKIGGCVQNIEWDKTGKRLAVLFQEGSNEYVAVFKTSLQPVLELLPCGLIKGEDGEKAHHISFQPSFQQGALLTIVWSSGRVGYIPLVFANIEEILPQPTTIGHSAYQPYSNIFAD